VKRQGQVVAAIATRDNLLLAFTKARRGRRAAREVLDLDGEVARLQEEIVRGTVQPGAYHTFEIRDPKPRRIFAPPFRDRVLHHAIMNVCEARMERALIDDTYACRRRKGTRAALLRAQQFARRFPFVLKLDVRRYFDSIDHGVLLRQLERLFKDRALLALFARILGTYATAPGKGLPIGTLTSQHFANLYLGRLDQFVKGTLRCRGYLRYMDDFLLFGANRKHLRECLAQVHAFLDAELRLALKPPILVPAAAGFVFLGFRVHARHFSLSGARKRRVARALRGCAAGYEAGASTEAEYAQRLQAIVAHTEVAAARAWRRRLLVDLARRGLPVLDG